MQKRPSAWIREGSSRETSQTVTWSLPRRVGVDVGTGVGFKRFRSGSGKRGWVNILELGRVCCLWIQLVIYIDKISSSASRSINVSFVSMYKHQRSQEIGNDAIRLSLNSGTDGHILKLIKKSIHRMLSAKIRHFDELFKEYFSLTNVGGGLKATVKWE